jgi:DNA-binding transcriptional MocR family regulator
MDFVRPRIVEYRNNLEDLLHKYIGEYAEWITPDAGLTLWIKLDERINVEKLAYELRSQGILIYPGSFWDPSEKNISAFASPPPINSR